MLSSLLFAYLFLYYLRPTEWVPGLIGTPLLKVAGILSLVVILQGVLSKRYPNVLSGQVERFMFGFMASILMSHIVHTYVGGTIASFNTLLPTLTGFLLVICFIDSRQRLNLFLWLLIALTVFLAYEGWRQYTTGFAHGGMEPIYQNSTNVDGERFQIPRIRWYGVFNDPNDLGLALILVVPFLMNMLLQRTFILPLIALPPIFAAIYYTNSRGTILAGLVGIASYFVIKYRSAKGFLIGAALAVVLFMFGPSRLATISAEEGSAYGRIEAWYEAYQMFKSNPLFGVGQGMFTDYHNLTAHNSFVLVMAELGFVGLFFFTGLFYFAYYWLWQNILKNKTTQLERADLGLISAAYASLTGMLTSMFFLSRAYVLLPFMALALVTSLTRIVGQDIQGAHVIPEEQPRHIRNIAVLTVLQIVGINILIKLTL
jgi:O-antigen ligase